MRLVLAAGLAGLVAACVPVAPVDPVPVPPARPDLPALPASALSERTAAYYASIQQGFLSRGLMRTDRGEEISLDAARVARAFINIAFYSEYSEQGGQLVAAATASRLQRWEKPVMMNIIVGPGVPEAQAAKDRADIAAYAARLAKASGHPITVTRGMGNFTVLILTEDERLGYGAELARLMPGLSAATRRAIIDMAPTTYCLVVARDDGTSKAYGRAVAVVRAEHPDLLRLSCIHEELAQGLGLANDDPGARPSIFNDDEEFALLTRLDEMLLRILYDPRLHSGMTEEEAAPIVHTIAEELVGGPA